MDIQKILEQRHSVRKYTKKEIDKELVEKLNRDIEEYNKIANLNIQFVTNEPCAFGKSILANYGNFKNVRNYIVMIGKKCDNLEEKIGYFGEKLVIKAQSLGLNTCWVGGTYSKKNTKYDIKEGEKLVCVIAVGYGETNGKVRKLKSISKVAISDVEMPDWFLKGVRFALFAPTALNQQRYKITLKDNKVEIVSKIGFYTKVDLGIIKCHFELGAGKEHYIFKF
ncbi:nitroreductase family protein [uncultured Parvimonas sp.]|uniref:nitroreductase family protein n=1 Tax=uncultured Parvimonas sp. TaxID=747372 RepID=UPI0028895A3B|nr:nitroreductase family protein [uncultured Parvimonas sp.]